MTPALAAAALLWASAASAEAVRAQGQRDGSAGALRVRADPPRIVLGPGARATVLVEGAGDAPPRLAASAGTIGEPRAVGGGAFAAEWTAPPEAYPRVAIVSALAGDRSAWIALPLVGTGTAVAHATPGSLIRVTIGEEAFGPARTDASGEARVRVVVPPGITKALHGATELDLNVPPTLHVHLAADRAVAPADREEAVTLRAFAVDLAGAPRPGAPVELAASEGRLEALAEVAPGSWVARWRLSPGASGTARARASLRDEGGLEAAVGIARPAGPAARIEVDPEVRRAVAGEHARVALRIRVTDAAGNPVAVPAPPRVEASAGTVEAVSGTGPGTFEAELALPSRLDGRRRVDVRVSAAGLSADATVELAPGAPDRLVLATSDAPLVADGSAAATLRAEVLDRFGNEVEDVVPALSSRERAGVAAERDASGGWTLRYRPARARSDARHDLEVVAGPLRAAATLSLVAPRPVLAVAPKLGVALSSGGLRSAWMAAEARAWTPWRDGRIGVALELGTFVLDRTDERVAGAATVRLHGECRYVPLLASAVWDGGRVGRGTWWVTVGAGGAYVDSTLTVDSGPALHDAGWTPVLQTTAGWGTRAAGGTVFAEARAAWHGDPGLETLRGSVTALVLAAGWRWTAW